MKRLRSLSIARPDVLDRRNYRSAWGIGWWLKSNRRKQLERQLRQIRRVIASLPRIEITLEVPLDGEPAVEAPSAPVVH